MRLRVLVACEMSGRVRDQFAARGWEAWSADLLPSESPDFQSLSNGDAHHYQGDVRDLFSWSHPVNLPRLDDKDTSLPLWDLIIAHPPCTDLSYAGARWFKEKQADGRQAAAAAFFMEMVNSPSPLTAVENPHSVMQRLYRGPDQIVQPYEFGDPYIKGIHWWLKGLPLLKDTSRVDPVGRVTTGGGSWRTDVALERKGMSAYEDSEGRKNRAKVRSRTFPGLASAIAGQWGSFAEEYYHR